MRTYFLFYLLTMVLVGAQLNLTVAQELNHRPTVKIVEPENKTIYALNSQVHYRIKVSDVEDGESDYEEIVSTEVFMEVRYLPDVKNISKEFMPSPDEKGLIAMKRSNCFNCHAFNGKLIAPSFYEINRRYSSTSSNIELLTKNIQQGSAGKWGAATMPSHTELTLEEARSMVDWILENASNPFLNYVTGTEGSIRIKSPEGANQKGAFVLSASYSDHGTKNNTKNRLNSKDAIVLYIK